MTKPATATQAQISRAIKAATKAGLRVKGISPDGTVLVDSGEESLKIAPEGKEDWTDGDSE